METPLLTRLEQLSSPIRVAVIGMGAMGKGLLYQCEITPGIVCVAIADLDLERAVSCAALTDRAHRIVGSLAELHDAVGDSALAVCEDGDLLARCESVDVLIEASSSIGPAGAFAATALQTGKDVVMMNAEADLIFGPHLLRLAGDSQVYTTCDGDQPGVIKHLIDDLTLWGFELVMAGNMKGFLDRYSDPTKIVPEADKRNLDYKMATAFTDGTKLCIEMALLANAYGLRTSVPGMRGPRTDHVQDVLRIFDFESTWGDGPVVDYVLGSQPDGGVFAVGYCDHDYQRSMLRYYKMGDGPFYLFYRPYHLCHVEAMLTVADAFLDRRALLQPAAGFRTNVYAYAKKDVRAGDVLDGLGGYTCYGLIENCDENVERPGLPICLAEDVTLQRDVATDEKINLDDVTYDDARADFRMFASALES